MSFRLGQDRLTSEILAGLVNGDLTWQITEAAKQHCNKYRNLVETALASGDTYYGINTGFGFLSDVSIEASKLELLQYNLIRSHACGVGKYLDVKQVKALLLLRIHTFLMGNTGISVDCVEAIDAFLAAEVYPAIPEKGSVGASGDLAPLAHIALALIGEGEVKDADNHLHQASEVLSSKSIRPYKLKPKEGLSLINGTHFMTVIAAAAVEESKILSHSADIILAMSLDGLRGTVKALDPRIHELRPQVGQGLCAANTRALFEGVMDGIQDSHKDCDKVQDPYSFRCAPQVHGACRDAIDYTSEKIDTELNSVTDNPLCFEGLEILSGGNFHGQPIAMAMDFLAIAVAELGSISERRIEKLTNPSMSGLPAFVTEDSGLNSGYMIPHVVAASLVSENKVLCHPASIDSIPTSADKEDHVSMGPIAARKARDIVDNVANILAIELLTACQSLDLIAPAKPNRYLEEIHRNIRTMSPSMTSDRSLHQDIKIVAQWIISGELVKLVKGMGIPIK